MKKHSCPPCRGWCDQGIYCQDLEQAKRIIKEAIFGYYTDWAEVERALQITGDLPSIEQIQKDAILIKSDD